jgi:hypothetical protein
MRRSRPHPRRLAPETVVKIGPTGKLFIITVYRAS